MKNLRHILPLVLLLLSAPAFAHVGSKDVFEQVSAGPYKLFVTIRPPTVIPGIATVEVRSTGANVTALHITPIPLTGEASKHPPTSDAMKPSNADPAFFTGAIWMMASGSWQVRFQVEGASGEATTSVPVPAIALSTLKMQRPMGYTLAALGLFLVLSMAGIVAAAVREARLPAGLNPTPQRRRRSLIAMSASLAIMALFVYGGGKWWNVEAATYAGNIYQPLASRAALAGCALDLKLSSFRPENPYAKGRSNDDFLPDHGHLIHLYAIREPEMDAVFHLHPTLAGKGDFRMTLPAMPPGHYTLYGDIVHASGFPETTITPLDIPATEQATAAPLGPDDAAAQPAPLSKGPLPTTYKLPDGYTLTWDRPSTLTASTAYLLHFTLLDPTGHPAADAVPYMGMAGHAAFVKSDGTVFAHTHPDGSAAMPALALANGEMAGMSPTAATTPIAPTVNFPYGFPTAGAYRILIQMKHGNTIETAAFDATVQ